MNRKIGFFVSYLLGFDPSKMPPWGVARRVADGVEDDEAVTVLVVVTMDARMEDIVGRIRRAERGLSEAEVEQRQVTPSVVWWREVR